MSALAFELAPALEASEPPEARGLARDDVRLMVASRSAEEIVHTRFRELPAHLAPGDLLVVNVSRTLPAAVPVTREGGAIELRFATRAPDDPDGDRHVVELRSADGEALFGEAGAGELIRLPGGARLELIGPYAGSERLWLARAELGEPLVRYLRRHGRPIRYGYVWGRWPLSAYQTAFASVPGSAEMPSAARPFTPRLIARLVSRGVLFAPLVLHTGVSSPERHEPPYPEQYEVPPSTARLVNAVRDWGGRVIAVGTTAVRALETVAAPDGRTRPGAGWTELVVAPERRVRAVDGMLTGWHEPRASHLQMLEALAGEELLRRCYASAVEQRYLWHEFGDSHLILP
ncbi:MAG TPA: S-adenosylmethionine:tRNA ribosyltransferase-isomerase [Solirubrobacteraceae bacterium]|nr:S-adenosylmethionine:tRNA ribosyltransferase-isomerase [Solirubrobacteraceae bacterium]